MLIQISIISIILFVNRILVAMSKVPTKFLDSDDENITKFTPGGVEVLPITINAGTSTSLLTPSTVRQETPEKKKEKQESRQTDPDIYAVLRRLDDLGRQISSMAGRQQAMHTLLLELRQEFEVIRSSSARFSSATATSGVRTIRRNKQ